MSYLSFFFFVSCFGVFGCVFLSSQVTILVTTKLVLHLPFSVRYTQLSQASQLFATDTI